MFCDEQLQATPRSSRTLSPTTPVKSPAPLRIVIEPTASGRKWIARLGDRVLCVSASPFVKSARLLLDEGYPADAVIEMWRPNTEEWALRGRLGAVAADGHRRRDRLALRQERLSGSRSRAEWKPEDRCRFTLVLGPFLGVDDDALKRSSTPKLGRTKEVA